MTDEHETSLQAVNRSGGIRYRWVCTCGQQGKLRSFPGHAAASGAQHAATKGKR